MRTLAYTLLLFLQWIPRISGVLFALLISFFAFDVFGQNAGFWKTLLAFLMHLVPTFLVVGLLILSWKWPWVGGVSFILLGIAYLAWTSQSGRGSPVIYVPLFVIAVLFLASWFLRKQIKTAQAAYRGDM